MVWQTKSNLGRTNFRRDTQLLDELQWRASETEQSKMEAWQREAPSSSNPATITYGKHVDKERVTDYTLALLKLLMLKSGVRHLMISSAYRSPAHQARVMYDNLKGGTRINYRAPGKAVVKRYDESVKASKTEPDVKQAMVDEIFRQGAVAVSKHSEDPTWVSVVDIDPSTISPVVRKTALQKVIESQVPHTIGQFLHPGNSKDPAFHLVIPQGKTFVAKAMRQEV